MDFKFWFFFQQTLIDSTDPAGDTIPDLKGHILFEGIHFVYPARKNVQVCVIHETCTYILIIFFHSNISINSRILASSVQIKSNQIKTLYCIDVDQNKYKSRKIYKTKLQNFKIRIYNVIL